VTRADNLTTFNVSILMKSEKNQPPGTLRACPELHNFTFELAHSSSKNAASYLDQ
jgi:hypothetical protein